MILEQFIEEIYGVYIESLGDQNNYLRSRTPAVLGNDRFRYMIRMVADERLVVVRRPQAYEAKIPYSAALLSVSKTPHPIATGVLWHEEFDNTHNLKFIESSTVKFFSSQNREPDHSVFEGKTTQMHIDYNSEFFIPPSTIQRWVDEIKHCQSIPCTPFDFGAAYEDNARVGLFRTYLGRVVK